MGFETVVDGNASGEWAPSLFVRWTVHEEPKENHLVVPKNESVTGYYLKSYEREYNGDKSWNHILIRKEDGMHLIVPGNKDVTKAFQSDRIVKGALTRLTYLGKKSFEYTKSDGNKGTAKAVKILLEQDRTDTAEFVGGNGQEAIAGTPAAAKLSKNDDAAITTADVPF